jgi:hypothetical protein
MNLSDMNRIFFLDNRTEGDAFHAFPTAQFGYSPANPDDILEEHPLEGGSSLMRVRSACGRSLIRVVRYRR